MTQPTEYEISGELQGARNELKAAQVLFDQQLFVQAVSSSYYAVFHAARAAIWKHGLHAKSHRGTAQLFGKEYIKTGQLDSLYSDILTGHREKREMADYDPVDFNISVEETAVMIADARQFVDAVDDLLNKSDSTNL